MMGDTTAARLRAIRSAGLGRVKQAAIRAGITTVEQDMTILRRIANGNTYRAAELSGVSETTVRKRLCLYA